MAKMLLWGVTGFTDSLVSFWTYSSKLPLRANRRESCEELGYIFVLDVPRAYHNTTKQKVRLVYPHSTPVMSVDEKFDFFSNGARVSPEWGSGALESHQNLGGAIPYVYK